MEIFYCQRLSVIQRKTMNYIYDIIAIRLDTKNKPLTYQQLPIPARIAVATLPDACLEPDAMALCVTLFL